MTKKGILLLIGLGGIVFMLLWIFVFGNTPSKKKAAIQFNAFPRSKVFIDDKEVGTTPYENDTIPAKDILIKLVPEATFSSSLEKRLSLNPSTQTVINWEFDADVEKTTGEILYLEKSGVKDKAGLMTTCVPDSCSVTVDGQMRGFTPLNIEDIEEGSHKVSISLPGYKTREVVARAIKNYRLAIEIKLAKEMVLDELAGEEGTASAKTKETTGKKTGGSVNEIDKPYVLISETPTGWLRVRLEPSISATETAKVDPGDKFPLLDEELGWYKIEYEREKSGWISGRYAEKFE